MPFDQGSFSAAIFELPQGLPPDYLPKFAAKASGTLDSVTDELQVGWVSGRHFLENTIDETTAIRGGACFVTLRKAVRKIPAALLNAMLKREELIWQSAEKKEYVPSKVRRELRGEILEKNLKKFPPAVSGVPVMIDLATNTLYAGTTSRGALDELVGAFVTTLDVEPLHFSPELLLERDFKLKIADFPALTIGKNASGAATVERDFLTYLWYCGENGVKFTHPEFGNFEAAVDGPLTLAGDAPECSGAAEISLKYGENPLHSAEAKAAIAVGKKLRKAKLLIAREGQGWSCTFNADNFSFGSLRLPEGEKLDADSVVADRVFNTYIFKELVRAAFATYANSMLGNETDKLIREIRSWAFERDGI